MKKNRILVALLITVILLLLGISFVGAYMRKQTAVAENEFVPATVSCEVEETFNAISNRKTSVKIKNTGKIAAYLRLRFVSYYVDSNGDILFESSPSVTFTYDNTCWIKSNDGCTYYYKMPVEPKDITKELLTSDIILGKDANGNRQVVEIFAEAIQSEPDQAVTNSWKVTLDAEGKNIVAAP